MKRLISILLLLCSINALQGQGNYHSVGNLVPNPSFEEGVYPWVTNQLGSDFCSPPYEDELCGSRDSPDGYNYVVLTPYNHSDLRKLAVPLIEPLVKDVRYQISFQVSLVDNHSLSKFKYEIGFYDSKASWRLKKLVARENDWITVYCDFTADRAYTHFYLKERYHLLGNDGAFFDDFQITECGYNTCSQTKDAIDAQFIMTGERFGITNIENVSSIYDIEIIRTNGSIVAREYTAYSVNGFKDIFWIDDHNLAQASYTIKFTLGNDCHTRSYSRTLIKSHKNWYTEPRKIYSDIKIPAPNCSNHIKLRSGKFYGDFPIVALQSITNAGDVIVPSNIINCEFVAGNSITFTPGFRVEAGANFTARIGTASYSKSSVVHNSEIVGIDTLNLQELLSVDDNTVKEEVMLENQNLSDNLSIRIFPNPTNGVFTIAPSKSNLPYSVSVYNSSGSIMIRMHNTVGEATVDISNHPKGVYFINTVNNEGLIENSKIIHQ